MDPLKIHDSRTKASEHVPDAAPSPRIALRNAVAGDLPILFEFQTDPAANRMAAFTAKDPTDRDAYMTKWTRLQADPTIVLRTIVLDGQVVGSIGSFLAPWGPPPPAPPQRHVTYWIAREYWGRGLATAALEQFLREIRERPLHASAAHDNAGSLRVLQKCGFRITGSDRAFANARGEEIEEVNLMLE